MRSSPVQLVHLVFDKVCVELDPRHAPQEPYGFKSGFMFEGVLFKTEVGFEEVEGAAPEEQVFEISLALAVENKKQKDRKNQRFSPYLLEVKGRAIVRMHKTASRLAPLEDLAVVNGAALIWGAMREHVANLTSRMPAGQILLPTVNFHDLKSDEREKSRLAAQAAADAPRLSQQTPSEASRPNQD